MYDILGPFIGNLTNSTARIWIQVRPELNDEQCNHSLQVSCSISDGITTKNSTLGLSEEELWTGIFEFQNLKADSHYTYKFSFPGSPDVEFPLGSLSQEELHFRTFPLEGYRDRLDFLLMSCHNPEIGKRKDLPESDGFEVWKAIPKIIDENPNIRFAVLGGDQVYLDKIQKQLLLIKSPVKRRNLILKVYRNFWNNAAYRRVLCKLPSYLMWDDHDITDGWGSERASFPKFFGDKMEFKPSWLRLYQSAKEAFWFLQASRNPDVFGLGKNGPFDTCFQVGDCAFVLADLRSNRNVKKNQIWEPVQFERIKKWVEQKRPGLSNLFFVSPVVFAHGDPKTEGWLTKIWGYVHFGIHCLLLPFFCFGWPDKWDAVAGDIRDDLDDAWGAKPNIESARQVLHYFFELQNPSDGKNPVNVVILTGDIHTSGYSLIYSAIPGHSVSPVIPHIVSSPVAYKPFGWVLEAYYRSRTKTVDLSEDGKFLSQISHHTSHRCVTVVSLRTFKSNSNQERQLKVKYYLEDHLEPTTVLFDLNRTSHREQISWWAPKVP